MDAVKRKQGYDQMVAKFYPPTDTIHIHEVTTGNASAGNGGNGTNNGTITNNPNINFDPYNKAYGAHVDVNTGDHVHQNADWDAGGANGVSVDPPSWLHITGTGGSAQSNGSQASESGFDTSNVHANTTAYQPNYFWADQHQDVYAGIGGNGGEGNSADGGSVDVFSMSLPPV
jgi:hypothetical protein